MLQLSTSANHVSNHYKQIDSPVGAFENVGKSSISKKRHAPYCQTQKGERGEKIINSFSVMTMWRKKMIWRGWDISIYMYKSNSNKIYICT